jgi:hypothetical protein
VSPWRTKFSSLWVCYCLYSSVFLGVYLGR